jgi:hypothetical protein
MRSGATEAQRGVDLPRLKRFQLLSIRDGNIKGPCTYQERQEALEAVGLSE